MPLVTKRVVGIYICIVSQRLAALQKIGKTVPVRPVQWVVPASLLNSALVRRSGPVVYLRIPGGTMIHSLRILVSAAAMPLLAQEEIPGGRGGTREFLGPGPPVRCQNQIRHGAEVRHGESGLSMRVRSGVSAELAH